MAVETWGHLWAWHGTPATVQDCAQGGRLAAHVPDVTGDAVERVSVDQGSTGAHAAQAAAAHHRPLEVVKLSEANKSFVLLPKRWGVTRSVGWAGRFRRLARDDEQLADTLQGLHCVACAIVMLRRFVELMVQNT